MDLKTIDEIFTKRILRIPAYQRGFSWGNNKPFDPVNPKEKKNIKGQLIDLWNDLTNIPEGSWHYTGLLTLVEVVKKDYEWLDLYKQYAIVDGQQRITSILILITVLIKKAEELNLKLDIQELERSQYLYIQTKVMNAYIFGYHKDNPSNKFFRKHILGVGEVVDDSKESVYTENLKKAKQFFSDIVNYYVGNDEETENRLIKLFKIITMKLKLNEYILPDELNEYVIFETMNNRGKPLSELEKLKNRLMYLNEQMYLKEKLELRDATLQKQNLLLDDEKKHIENSINKAWITIYQELGHNKNQPLDDEDFIKNHWIIYFNQYNRSEARVYANFLFNECFTLEKTYKKELSRDIIQEYVKSLQNSSIIWNKIHNLELFSQDENKLAEIIRGLHRVGFRASFKPITLSVLYNRFNGDSLELFKLLEEYAFKVFHISDRQSNTGDSRLFKLAGKIYFNEISIKEACNKIKIYINDYYHFEKFKNHIGDLFNIDDNRGYYDWSGRYYFLFEYDQELRKTNRTNTKASKLNWEDFNNKNSIEHIYPQSAAMSYEEFCTDKGDTPGRNKDYEKLQEDWKAFSGYSSEEKRRFCNSLGNLLAISSKDNSSLSNDPYKYKVDQSEKGEKYKKRGYKYDSLSAQILSSDYEDWTPETIKERGITMIDFLLILLGEENIDEEQKLDLLGLEFLNQKSINEGDNK